MTPAKTLAVLAYHKIGPPSVPGWDTWSYVSTDLFERHLRHLCDDGWQVLDLDTCLGALELPDSLPARAALITFDDGYRSNLELALPLLRRFGFPAVMFVPTAFVGGYNAFDADIEYEPREDLCSWDDLRALDRAGVAIQSHGCNHRRLSELTPDQRLAEMIESKAILEARLERPVTTFAFPYGDDGGEPHQTSRQLAAAGYRAAFRYGGGLMSPPIGDQYALARVPVGADTSLVAALGDSP
jgi:peptidoglycan/xylan/chitin deacetylase (PgdA/CDA1 family)